MKFKVGDKVKIINGCSHIRRGDLCWDSECAEVYLNKIGTILEIDEYDEDKRIYRLEVRTINVDLWKVN